MHFLLVIFLQIGITSWPGVHVRAPDPSNSNPLFLPHNEAALPDTGDANNAQTNALLDCYTRALKAGGGDNTLGAPHLTYSLERGYVLRADFAPHPGEKGLTRIVCRRNSYFIGRHLDVPPLGESTDAASQHLLDAWNAKLQAADAARRAIPRLPPPDPDTARRLEGIWLVNHAPESGPCVANTYPGVEMEFDFRKTGGRALIWKGGADFTPVAITGIARQGDRLTIQSEAREGGFKTYLRVRIVDADHLELFQPDAPAGAPGTIAYRCGAIDTSVNADIALDRLAALSPVHPVPLIFYALVPGKSDSEMCNGGWELGDGYSHLKWIQFELLGPVHYYVDALGFDYAHSLRYAYVRSIKAAGDHTLKLELQEDVSDAMAWDVPQSRGAPFELTVLEQGNHIEIPELATTFVRCTVTDELTRDVLTGH